MISRPLVAAALFSLAHFILLFAVTIACLMFGSHHLDSDETSLLLTVGLTLHDILGFPGFYIWDRFQLGSHLPVIADYLAMVANSLLWGSLLAFVYARKKSSP